MWAVTSGFALRASGEAVPIRTRLNTFSTSVGERQGREGQVLDLSILGPLKAKYYLMRRDQAPKRAQRLALHRLLDSERMGAQPHSPKDCLPGSGWESIEHRRVA